MSRLRTLLLFAALAGLAIVFAACGGSDSGSSDESPEAVLKGSTFEGIESADLDLSVNVDVSGDEGGNVDASVSGPFQSKGGDQLPELDLNAEAKGSVGGKDVDFDGGIVLVPNKAYVSYEGEDYEVDPTTFSFVQSAIEEAQQKSGAEGGTEGATKCQEEAAGKFSAEDFVDNLTNEGSADVGGTETTKVSGDLDISGAIDAVLEVAESEACRAQLAAAGPLPAKSEIEDAKSEVNDAVKSAHVDIDVGDDNIVRGIDAQLAIEPKNGGSGPKSVEIDLDLKLTDVNEEQKISAPENAKPLSKLFLKLGVNPIELLGLLQGEGGGESLGELFEGLGASQLR
ncbi:MAG TPA: hypothetical protein VN756_10065 [Solirubrobacterales bacterium]|nr:hypothetical protein [Solirubrobacterales bacterium]